MKLPEGLAVITKATASDVVYVGIAVGAGTRHETDNESGMAHFLEHMSFKGTGKRSAGSIFRRMESVGGEMNAYTGKEETVYYCACEKRYLNRAVELLVDIVFHSTYPDREMEKEVEVVLDEIESYNDSPSDLIYDDFEALLFPDNPLGRNILGKPERLREYCSEDMKRFAREHYRPENAVLFIMGGGPLPASEGIVKDNAGAATRKQEQTGAEKVAEGKVVTMQKGTHQAHVMMGTRAYGARDKRHLALFLLNNILGGPAMSSRLNISLRERRGLVYTIQSMLSSYTDTGLWGIYFGCDHKDEQRCLKLCHKQLERFKNEMLTPRQLLNAQKQLCGQLGVSRANLENNAIGMAKNLLRLGQVKTLEQNCQRIMALTPDDINRVANEVFNTERLRTAIIC